MTSKEIIEKAAPQDLVPLDNGPYWSLFNGNVNVDVERCGDEAIRLEVFFNKADEAKIIGLVRQLVTTNYLP